MISVEQLWLQSGRKRVHLEQVGPSSGIKDNSEVDLDLGDKADRKSDFVMCSVRKHYRVVLWWALVGFFVHVDSVREITWYRVGFILRLCGLEVKAILPREGFAARHRPVRFPGYGCFGVHTLNGRA